MSEQTQPSQDKIDRKASILDAATALFLAEGIGVSTAKIAKAAAVSNGTLFNYFPTKQALIDAIYARAKSGKLAALANVSTEGAVKPVLFEIWSRHLTWAKSNPPANQIVTLLHESGAVSEELDQEINQKLQPFADFLQSAIDNGDIRAPDVYFVSSLALLYLDLVQKSELSSEQEAIAFEMFWNSINNKETP